MAGPRTFAEEYSDTLELERLSLYPDDNDKKPFSEVEIVKSTIDSSLMFIGIKTFYYQEFIDQKFGNDSPYYGSLSTRTQFYFTPPSQKKQQELPMLIDGEYTYFYSDPLEKPVIKFYRLIDLRLDTGNSVKFAVFGSMQIPDTIYPHTNVTIADLERYMNTPDSPFVLSGLDTEHMNDLSGFHLGMREDINTQTSMNQVLMRMGLGKIAKVDMSAKEQYDFMVDFIEAHPALNGWLNENAEGEKSTHNDKGKAEEAVHGSRNSVVTKVQDKYKASILSIKELAEIADQLRRRQNDPDADGPLGKDETVESALYQGQLLSNSELIELFHTSVDVAVIDPEGNSLANVLVFKMEDGYFGRQVLTKEEAREHWKTLDEVAKPEDLRKWDVKEKFGLKWIGTFEFLDAQGTIEVHRIGENYYKGRRFFTSNKEVLNRTLLNSTNDGENMGYAELTALSNDSGEHLYWYLRGELDRPATDAVYFRSIINTYGTKNLFIGSFQSDLGAWIYNEVNKYAQQFAIEQVSTVSTLLNNIWKSQELLEAQLGALPSMNYEQRRNILSAFGYEHDALEDLTDLFSDKKKTAELLLGVEVDGYTIEGITERIGESAKEVDEFLGNIYSGQVDVLVIEGEFGDSVRKYAYEKAGFTRLKYNDFPHDDQASNEYTLGQAYYYNNTKEQLYAYYISNTEGWKLFFTILVVVIVAVVIALATMGIGLFAAGALGLTGYVAVFTGGAIAGVLFTVVSEVILQSMGQGTLNRDKDAYGVREFLGQMFLNAVMFAAFGALGEFFGTMSAAAKSMGASKAMLAGLQFERISFLAMLFTSYSLTHFYFANGRLPEGREWKKFWMENILALVLFEVGGAMARTGLMRVRSSGYNVYAKRMTGKFESAMADLTVSQKSIADSSTGEIKPQDVQVEMVKTYINRVRALEKLFAKYQKKSDGTGWELRDAYDNIISVERAKQIEADLKLISLALERALHIKVTGTENIVGAKNTLSYNGTKEGAKAILKAHRDRGDKVLEIDDVGRILVIREKDGSIIEYLPDSQISSVSLQKILLAENNLSGSLRQISKNVMGVDQEKIVTLKEQFKDGKWVEIKEGKLYFGETEVSGEKVSMFFMVEEKLNIANDAWLSEQSTFGTGLSIIRSNLRSKEAIEGYTDYVENKWKYLQENQKVKEFWKLEQQGKSEGKHLNKILEEHAREVVKERKAVEKADIETKRGNLVGASGKSYEVSPKLDKYIGEENGLIFERPFTFERLSVNYLNEAQRVQYEVFVGERDGLLYDINGDLISTIDAYHVDRMLNRLPADAIFVMDGNGRIFMSKYSEFGRFHHSSFLAGEPVSVAGEAKILGQSEGEISIFNNNSGHYRLESSTLDNLKLELERRGANMEKIKFQSFKTE